MPAAPETVLAGRYRLVEYLATGSIGEVWRATDDREGRRVAVKILSHEFGDDPACRARFHAEARRVAGVSHAGIVAVYDYGPADGEDGPAFLVTEYVDGEPLSQRLARTGRLDSHTTLKLVSQVARALQAAHDAGVVHRDVKPHNLMLTEDESVKVTDFGIARGLNETSLTPATQVVGTPSYMSPEQARGYKASPAMDIYSLGVCAYECLAGTTPYADATLVEIVSAHTHKSPLPDDVPLAVAELIELRCLARDPQRRPRSAAELAELADLLGEPANAQSLSVLAIEDLPVGHAQHTRVKASKASPGRGSPWGSPSWRSRAAAGATATASPALWAQKKGVLLPGVATGVAAAGLVVVFAGLPGPPPTSLPFGEGPPPQAESRESPPAGSPPRTAPQQSQVLSPATSGGQGRPARATVGGTGALASATGHMGSNAGRGVNGTGGDVNPERDRIDGVPHIGTDRGGSNTGTGSDTSDSNDSSDEDEGGTSPSPSPTPTGTPSPTPTGTPSPTPTGTPSPTPPRTPSPKIPTSVPEMPAERPTMGPRSVD